MGWHVYKRIGADVVMIAMYKRYQLFCSLLKLDLMLGFVLIFTGLMGRAWDTTWGFVTTLVSLTATIVWVFVGWQAAMREHVWAMRFVLVFALYEPAYLIYKIIVLRNKEHGDVHSNTSDGLSISLPAFDLSLGYMIFLVVAALVVRAAVFTLACVVRYNFGHGLRDHLLETKVKPIMMPLFT
mmetsp:Transcript_52841/g.123488  ORF Transcript_52841/g.123488 Transcript_52841/m.123488 type:complete len:183 (+) Transcript_52841:398-946(+)